MSYVPEKSRGMATLRIIIGDFTKLHINIIFNSSNMKKNGMNQEKGEKYITQIKKENVIY